MQPARPLTLALSCAAAIVLGSVCAAETHTLSLPARSRPGDDGQRAREQNLAWDASKTAIIICDMWNAHWCRGATRRVAEMAPVMNRVVHAAREKGVFIVHAPSSTLGFYEGTPQRDLARKAPAAGNLPKDMDSWCSLIQGREGDLPIDDSDGGCDCQPRCPSGSPWSRQIDTIDVVEGDAVTDSGREVWNLFEQRGIDNVILMGVHTNMCVLGRSFGVRNMVRHGKNVVLMRDLTDTMYNSRMRPRVSHFRGTDLVIEHIERHWCPTVTSTAFTGAAPFRFKNDRRPHVVIVTAEKLYGTQATLERFAHRVLEGALGWHTTHVVPSADDPERLVGLEALRTADLLVLSARRRALPEAQLALIRKHLDAGKPLVALRTSSHAFHTRGKSAEGHAEWQEFDAQVLGGNYHGHHAEGPIAVARAAPGAAEHPILRGVELPLESSGSLYKASPLAPDATPLLIGSIEGQPAEPVAWTHRYGDARVFYTSFAHPSDFETPQYVRLLENAMRWAVAPE